MNVDKLPNHINIILCDFFFFLAHIFSIFAFHESGKSCKFLTHSYHVRGALHIPITPYRHISFYIVFFFNLIFFNNSLIEDKIGLILDVFFENTMK